MLDLFCNHYHKGAIFMEFRKEHDALGEVLVPADHKWGAQIERSHKNFKIGERMPMEIIYALAVLKKACAKVNFDMGKIDRLRKMLFRKPAMKS